MKDDLAFKQSKRLGHTRQHFDIFNQLANWAVNEAGGKDKVFGTKPTVADYKPTDLTTEAGRAAKGNLANYDDIIALLDKMIPGFSEQQKQGSKNTLSMLRGEIPEDVQSAVKRNSAFRALSGGYGGSGMSKALTARDFGRTSLDLMGEGTNSAQKWASFGTGVAAPFIVTAPAQAEMTMKNNLYSQAVEQMRANVLAAPDPGAAGIFNLQTAMGAMAASFFGGKGGSLGTGANPNQAGSITGGGGGGMSGGASSLGNYWGGYSGGG